MLRILEYSTISVLEYFEDTQALGSLTLARVSSKYSNTEIVEYSKILSIEIGFGENTITKNLKKQRSKNLYTPQIF